jgi:tetratricopeptide (TPR) repeat protein
MSPIAVKALFAGVLLIGSHAAANCQEKPAADESQSTPASRGVKLALEGRCSEAMPLLKEVGSAGDREVKRLVGKAGVRCSMLLNQPADATIFLARLQQEFPRDPDILFLAVHVYSDLSLLNSRSLMDAAPDSTEVIQLNAENFEKQGDLQKAIAEYRVLLQRAPAMPGIHYRIGGLIMAQPDAATSSEEARKEFEAELKIFPQNAGAEYYVGELARQQDKLPEAIEHFARSAKLYPDFAEAHFGLGRSLLDSGRASDAASPLETAVKLAPENPTMHFALATAYQRLGRKEEAAREFALQKSTSERINQNTKTLRKNVSGAGDGRQ